MLMEADLPNDVEALRALVLEQSRTLATERAARADLALAKGEADADVNGTVKDPGSGKVKFPTLRIG